MIAIEIGPNVLIAGSDEYTCHQGEFACNTFKCPAFVWYEHPELPDGDGTGLCGLVPANTEFIRRALSLASMEVVG